MIKSLFFAFILLNVFCLFSQDISYVIEDDEKYKCSMILEDLDYLSKKYDNYVFPMQIGYSEFGIPLKVVRIGRKQKSKYSILMVGNIHAREDYSKRDDKNFMKHTLAWQSDKKVEIKYRDVHSRTLTNDVQYFPPKERVY